MAKKFEFGAPGADVTLPDVSLTIGGKEFQLCFDMASIATVEVNTGINLLAAVMNEPSLSSAALLVWASALKSQPKLKLSEVQACIKDPRAVYVIYDAVQAAWIASVPEPEEILVGNGDAQAEEMPTPVV